MKKVYLAASFAYSSKEKTEARKSLIERVEELLKEKNLEVYVPHKHKIPNAWDMSMTEWSRRVFEMDKDALDECDILLFLSFGKENNSGAVWECGYAYGKNIPVITVRMTKDVESLMVTGGSHAVIDELRLKDYDFDEMPVVYDEPETQSQSKNKIAL